MTEKFFGLNDKRLNEMADKIQALENIIKNKNDKIKKLEEENSHLQWVCLNTLKKIKMKGKVKKECADTKTEASTL